MAWPRCAEYRWVNANQPLTVVVVGGDGSSHCLVVTWVIMVVSTFGSGLSRVVAHYGFSRFGNDFYH